MNLQQLKYVLAIYKEGSITKASHALFCAQPNEQRPEEPGKRTAYTYI